MYTVIGTAKTRAARVLWLLEEMGLPYSHIPAAPQSPDARAHNPIGKVPALIDGDATLTDSTAILTYLADKHGRFTAPAGTIARAHQDGMTQFLLDEFDANLWTAARHSFALPEEHRLPAIKDTLRWEYARSLARLSAKLAQASTPEAFLMGDQLTLPDIIAAHCLMWGKAIRFPPPEGPLADYLTRCITRPAYLRVTSPAT